MSFRKFQNKTTWLFDLDNTLYSPKLNIFKQIDLRMKRFISKKLKISQDEAFDIQKKFYKKYGTTLYGLTKHYQINPEEFLRYVHDIDFSYLKISKSLNKKIKNLPGKKIIYTNGDSVYAKKILNSLGIKNLFFDIFDIKKANYLPKPMASSLCRLLETYNLKPMEVAYFDDLEKNLKSAHLKGITTIHISLNQKFLDDLHIDFRFRTIINALDVIKNSFNNGKNNELKT
ncbi:MAG: pyrimidine 5'-nucleotidase [Pseudomonadota bacterium]|nr:pyrimidine 5'-nucleotidase [Pseudomonadota bacterium]